MATTIHVRDNADGTGVTASVSDYTSGTLRWWRALATYNSIGSYSAVGTSITANNTQLISGTGYYYWRLLDGGGTTLHGPELVTATTVGDSLWDRCLTAVRDGITRLSLVGSPTVVDGLIPPAGSKPTTPFITVSPTNQTVQRYDPMDVDGDSRVYPVYVQLHDRIQPDSTTVRQRFMHWAHRIIAEFTTGAGYDLRIPEVFDIEAEHVVMIDKDSTHQEKIRFDQIVIMCRAHRDRGWGWHSGDTV